MSKSIRCLKNSDRKKRLGQYFTDKEVVELLLELANVNKDDAIIDPMAGLGDMLNPLLHRGHDPSKIYGIEIDPIAGGICNDRLKIENCVIGNAFNINSYNNFTNIRKKGWDLVITNPPYVRYQSMSTSDYDKIEIPDSKEVRRGLLEIINSLSHLDKYDKEYFKILAEGYSGLSDLAVPSWILCSALLKVGGKLAIIVPETWFNREYASIVQYILFKWFKIEYVVEDVNHVWFLDAQVKTNLIIASRVDRLDSIYSDNDYKYCHIKVYGDKTTKIGTDVSSFSSKKLEKILKLNSDTESKNIVLNLRNINNMVSDFIENNKTNWLHKIEGEINENKFDNSYLPYELSKLLGLIEKNSLLSIKNLGLKIGQGLRTGANKFFYLTNIETWGDYETVETNKEFNNIQLKVSSNMLYKVIRKQSDLPKSLLTLNENIKGRLLYIQDSITQDDMNNTDNNLIDDYSLLNEDLNSFIYKASQTPVNKKNPHKLIPSLSAVKPNIRIETVNDKKRKRYWYMLPRLTNRHTPDFYIPRINNNSINTYMITEDKIVVDANFSTLWISSDNSEYKLAYFAILNSSWVKAYLECIATIMGGGALKVEAAHIKKIKIPLLDKKDLNLLNSYGLQLSETVSKEKYRDIIKNIDYVMLRKTFNNKNDTIKSLKTFIVEKVTKRKNI